MDFDPNATPPKPAHRWGSYRPDCYGKNRTKWKTHSHLGHVRAAIDFARNIIVYERVNDRWVERYRHSYGDVTIPGTGCYVCALPVDENHRGHQFWSPDADFEKVECHWDCRRKLGGRKR